MRILPTSLTLAGFTVLAGLAGCSSDGPATPGGTSGAPGNSTAGTPGTPTAGNGSAGAPVLGGAGSSSTAGTGSNTAGANNTSGGGNSAGAGPVGGSGNGGTPGTAGSGTGGSGPVGGGGGSADPNAPDQLGKTNAKPGAMTGTKFDYLKMGEIRILNNNWGSAAWGCTDKAPQSVFINADKSFGWSFDRPNCDTGDTNTKPDFPQLEFGIHPFGLGSADATSPNFSSTTLLPKQIKDITSASVTLTDLKIELEKEASWDLTFEFWLSEKNPATTQNDAGVYAELMTFWGWQANRWPDAPLVRNSKCTGGSCPMANDMISSAGTKSYKLVVQDDAWGKWRYFQFRDTTGPGRTFANLTVDVKKLIDYLVSKGYSKDLWVSRLEVGSEIDDDTKGKVTMKNVEFEVNGQKRSPVFGQ